MSEHPIYRLLEVPWLFRLQQGVLAPGIQQAFTKRISALLTQLPPARRLLDVGCGPKSWLFGVGLHPVGLDRSWPYARDYAGRGERAIVGSADGLPFASQSFDGVWSIGLLHHLPDPVAVGAVNEMVRVCTRGGYVAVLDAVMPRQAWRRPLAYALRRMDRGRFVRPDDGLRALFPQTIDWRWERFTFAATGLEALVGWVTKAAES